MRPLARRRTRPRRALTPEQKKALLGELRRRQQAQVALEARRLTVR